MVWSVLLWASGTNSIFLQCAIILKGEIQIEPCPTYFQAKLKFKF